MDLGEHATKKWLGAMLDGFAEQAALSHELIKREKSKPAIKVEGAMQVNISPAVA